MDDERHVITIYDHLTIPILNEMYDRVSSKQRVTVIYGAWGYHPDSYQYSLLIDILAYTPRIEDDEDLRVIIERPERGEIPGFITSSFRPEQYPRISYV